MLDFSKHAWKGFAFYYKVLDTIHFTKPVTWDPKTKYLCRNKQPRYFLWGIALSCAILVALVIPSFLFLEFVFAGYNPSRDLTYEKVFALTLFFLGGIHSLPTSIKLITVYDEMITGFNLYIRVQRHVKGNVKFSTLNFQTVQIQIELIFFK